jgi:NTE family protein
VALVLGGGAARGYAHLGVIKVLDANHIPVHAVVGTSAGSVVGALYAGGLRGQDLVHAADQIERQPPWDWGLLPRGFVRGERLQQFVNDSLRQRTIEQLGIPFIAVATDLSNGALVPFTRGDTGMAVRASSSVPGVFQPVTINGRDYVDGGLVSPVPVEVARRLGADLIIAVDVSRRPEQTRSIDSTLDVLLQTILIMGRVVGDREIEQADILIRPPLADLSPADFSARDAIIALGTAAAEAALPELRRKLALARTATRRR